MTKPYYALIPILCLSLSGCLTPLEWGINAAVVAVGDSSLKKGYDSHPTIHPSVCNQHGTCSE